MFVPCKPLTFSVMYEYHKNRKVHYGDGYMNSFVPLYKIKVGQQATVRKIDSGDGIKRRLMDMGLVENTGIECVGKSPLGDPSAYLIRGAVVAVRSRDCESILVEVI